MMKTFFRVSLLVFVASFFLIGSSYAKEQSIIGKWKTIDDGTNKPKSIVQIYEKQGKYFGKIIELFENPDQICDKCSDADPRKDQPVKGMEILQGLIQDGEEYNNGNITDPDNGKTYDCKMWIEEGNLQVRGYIAFFFRTQTWLRVE